MELYLDLTVRTSAPISSSGQRSAIPALEATSRPFLDGCSARSVARGSSLIMGLLRRDPDSGDYYNAIARWTPRAPRAVVLQAPARAVRRVLPRAAFVRNWMRLMSLPNSDFAAGHPSSRRRFEVAGERLAPTICYEDAYGVEQLRLGAPFLTARQRQQRCVVRRLHGAAPAPRHQPHARARERTRDAARRQTMASRR